MVLIMADGRYHFVCPECDELEINGELKHTGLFTRRSADTPTTSGLLPRQPRRLVKPLYNAPVDAGVHNQHLTHGGNDNRARAL